MTSKYLLLFIFLFFCGNVLCMDLSSSLVEMSYEYIGLDLGKTKCLGENDFWTCAKEKVAKILDSAEEQNNKRRELWQEVADAEVLSSARTFEEPPSKLGIELEELLLSVADMMQHGMARALSRKHSDGDGIDSITVSTGGSEKNKKIKKKPAKLVSPVMVMRKDEVLGSTVQSWVIGKQLENDSVKVAMDDKFKEDFEVVKNGSVREARNIITDMWGLGDKAVNEVAEHAFDSEHVKNGITDISSVKEQRGKKKKDKGILALLMLGSALKGKIGTMLQILSFKLQVKFFLIALIGLAVNVARFLLDLKKHRQQQPPKVLYYEHAQHEHHNDHEVEPQSWGGQWSRSMDLEEDTEIDTAKNGSPYRAQIERNTKIFTQPPLS